MRYNTSTALLVLVCVFFNSILFPQNTKKRNQKPRIIEEQLPVIFQNDYEKLWRQIDSLDNIKMTLSAKKIAEEIYQTAICDNNSKQALKALIVKLSYERILDNNNERQIVKELKDGIIHFNFPEQCILQSTLAREYQEYYKKISYKITQRSAVQNDSSGDFETWSLQKLREEIEKLFSSSIEKCDELKRIPADEYSDIISRGNDFGDKFRSTLYDILCHQALNYFRSELFNTNTFGMVSDELNAFGTAQEFIDAATKQSETIKNNNYLSIIKDLTLFHLNDSSQAELADIDLIRLEYLRSRAGNSSYDSQYLSALNRLLLHYNDSTSIPRILAALADFYFHRSSFGNENSEEYKWTRKTALDYCEIAISNYPGSFGAKGCEAIKNKILSKELYLQTENAHLPAEPSLVSVTCRNVNTVYFRIIEAAAARTDSVFKNDASAYSHYLTISPFKQFASSLPVAGDYYSHTYEIIFPSLPIGKYICLASSDSSFSGSKGLVLYRNLCVTNLCSIISTEDGKNEIYVLDRKSGKPLEGVSINIRHNTKYSGQKVQFHTTATTNEDGYAEIEMPDKYCIISLSSGVDSFELEYYLSDLRDYYKERIKGKTVFFMDRNIYRPGQTVFFKGVSMLHDSKTDEYEAWDDRNVTVSLYDANDKIIDQIRMVTNKYGSFSGHFDLPVNLRNGMWCLSDGFCKEYFHVEEYKRPQFEVMFDKTKGQYSLNDEITITGKSVAYSGALLSGAAVKFRVERYSFYPYGNWKYLPGHSPYASTYVSGGSTIIGETGEFSVTFKAAAAPGDEIKSPLYSYRVYAEVVDKTGESHNAETTIKAGYISLLTDINIPEVVNKRQNSNCTILTKDLNGNFRATQVNLTILKLKNPERIFKNIKPGIPRTKLISKEEFYQIFKNDVYSDESDYLKWEKGNKVYDTTFITSSNQSFDSRNFYNLEQGKYILILSAEDINGRTVEAVKYFTLLDPEARRIPLNDALWFYPFKNSAEPGENLVISLGTALENMNILFEVESKGKTLKREWYKLSNEQRLVNIPIREKYRGTVILHCYAVWENSIFSLSKNVTVPWSNKKLSLKLETFRSKITPGETETWALKVSDQNGNPVEAEVLAAMYDASLDALYQGDDWEMNLYKTQYWGNRWNMTGSFFTWGFINVNRAIGVFTGRPEIRYNEFYYYGLFHNHYESYGGKKYKSKSFEESLLGYPIFKKGVTVIGIKPEIQKDAAYSVLKDYAIKEEAFAFDTRSEPKVLALNAGIADDYRNQSGFPMAEKENDQVFQVITRRNFNETAFFYPSLVSNEDGIVEFSFKAPEALTKWKFMAVAHTEDLEYGLTETWTITQKKLMIQAYPPRFFRENDTIWFTSRVSNLTDSLLSGKTALKCYDSFSLQPIDEAVGNSNPLQDFQLMPMETKSFRFKLVIPEGKLISINCKVLAASGGFTDGEENSIPVLSNDIFITESIALPLNGNESRSFVFENLRSNRSSSLKNYKLTLEFTSNPAFLALQTLPSLLEFNFESTDNLFNSYLASSIAMHVVNSNPKIKEVFDSWKRSGRQTLSSNLHKNRELKSVLLEETPWITEAQNETERKERIGLLFDYANLSQQLAQAEEKLSKMQLQSGGWAWFPGLPENLFITQSIIAGFGHLENLGITDYRRNYKISGALWKAVQRCDKKMYEDFISIKLKGSSATDIYINNEKIQYLFARSYFPKFYMDSVHIEAFNFWKKQAIDNWESMNIYLQGMIALACYRNNNKEEAQVIIKSILDNAINDKELGMYFQQKHGFSWYQAPIETQALLIEAADEILHDKTSVDKMKIWLLKNKQANCWNTGRATAEAVYALILRGTDWLAAESGQAEIQVGDEKPDITKDNSEAGTGYIKLTWDAGMIKPEMSQVSIKNNNSVPAWGALFWQYFEKMDKLKESGTSFLSIKKELYVKTGYGTDNEITPITAENKLRAGDVLKVRLIIKAEKDMEYIHIKDMRAAGLEPENVISMNKYQDGLYYYESMKDASANFYIDRLPRGTYVFEYPLKVTYDGSFSSGIASIQCLYAPEFISHSDQAHIKVQ